MKSIICTICICCLALCYSKAQEFLTIQPDVRHAGLGEVSIAMPGSAFSIFNNAAAPVFGLSRLEFGLSFTPWMRKFAKGYSLTSLGGYYQLNPRHTLSLGVRFYREPETETTASTGGEDFPFVPKDENNNPITGQYASFRPHNTAVDLGYGYKISEYIGVGITGRFAGSSLGDFGKSQAVAFDLSAYSRLPIAICDSSSLHLGAGISNLGFSSGDFSYDLPASATAGISLALPFALSHSLLVAADCRYKFQPSAMRSFSAGVGAEYTLFESYIFRGGYHVGDHHGYNYGTFGLGIRFRHLEADASYLVASSDCPLRNTYRIGVSVSF